MIYRTATGKSGPFFLGGGSFRLCDSGIPSASFTTLGRSYAHRLTKDSRLVMEIWQKQQTSWEPPEDSGSSLSPDLTFPPRSILSTYDDAGSVGCPKKRCHEICRNMFWSLHENPNHPLPGPVSTTLNCQPALHLFTHHVMHALLSQ